jgi:ABC-type lipoprotein release transport system permease subunit
MWAWVRVDVRGRARSLAVLALLVALTTGVVLTAVAGARRGSTAVGRLLDRTKPATIAVLPNEPGFDWDPVAALPDVAGITRFPLSGYEVEGLPPDTEAVDFSYADDEVMRTIERPVVLEGRLADATRDDEAVITHGFEDTFGKGVGDTLTVELYSPEQVDESYLENSAPEAPAGPIIETRIVGVVRSPWFSDTADADGGRVIPSPGLYAAHPRNFLGASDVVHVNALVRLEGGADAIPRFRRELAEVSGRTDIEFLDLAAAADHANDVADFEANALLAFAAAAFVAAVFLVGQSVARYVAGTTSDLHILSTFGMPPRQVRAAAAAGPTLAAVVGVALGVGAAVLASPRFPIGTVAPLEPSPGRHADLTVIAFGSVVILGLVVGGAVVASWAASRSVAGRGAERPAAVATLAARLGVPVPVMVGTRFALERGRGANAVPVYPALVGAVVGVLGVISALTFGAGVSDAGAHPERFGQVTDLQGFLGFNGEDFLPTADVLKRIAEDPDVIAVNDTRQAVAESGPVDFPVFALAPVGGRLPIVVTRGRPPEGSNEIALAPETADALGLDVGDRVDVTGVRSSGSYTVSGIAFVPEGSHNSYDSGAWVGPDTYDELFEGFKFHTTDVTLRSGADPGAVADRVGEDLAGTFDDPELAGLLGPPEPIDRLAELQQIRRLPLFLAAFLALLAVAAVGHAVATTVRRRRHDLAVLRALGVTRWQSRVTVLTQATLLALFGLALGVPLGLALGRTLWRGVADSTPIDYVSPVAVAALLIIAPAALLAANLLAAWPSHRAATMRVGHVLRTE